MCSDLAGRRGGGELIIIQSRRFEHLTRLKVMGNRLLAQERTQERTRVSSSRPPFFLTPIYDFQKKKISRERLVSLIIPGQEVFLGTGCHCYGNN